MRESVDSADEDKDAATEKDTEKLDDVNSTEVKMEGLIVNFSTLAGVLQCVSKDVPSRNGFFTNHQTDIS